MEYRHALEKIIRISPLFLLLLLGISMKLVYPAIFTPFEDGKGYTVEVPDLSGCVTEGKDMSDAISMGTDAASGWVLTELEDGEQIPKASLINQIKATKGSFVSLLSLDMDLYAEKYGNKSVKKTLTIPAWMDTFVQHNHISCSELLQNAISKIAMM